MSTDATVKGACIAKLAILIEEIKPGLSKKIAITENTTLEEMHFDSLDFIRLLSMLSELRLIDEEGDFSGITDVGQICTRLKAYEQVTGVQQC